MPGRRITERNGGRMDSVGPVYWQLLIGAIAIYVIGTCFIMSDLYAKVGALEHALACESKDCTYRHQ